MSTQKLVERILSDAEAEAAAIISEAENKAAKMLADASARNQSNRQTTEIEVKEKCDLIFEKRAAAARLDSAKLLLKEKRKVIDAVYILALQQLQAMKEEDCLRLLNGLLVRYAEEGDEIYFAENFNYCEKAALLPVITEKSLRISKERLPISGGMRLKGEKSDKDLSYEALLASDRENNQAQIAAELFK